MIIRSMQCLLLKVSCIYKLGNMLNKKIYDLSENIKSFTENQN